jgi:chitinase
VLTQNDWDTIFPDALDIYTYDNFLRAAGKYPKFCDEVKEFTGEASLQNACKLELATLLAHMKHTSQGLSIAEKPSCANSVTSACDYHLSSTRFPATAGAKYYGRGPLMLSYNPQYGALSNIAFGGGLNDSNVLLDNPSLVAEDGRISFLSAIWYYMTKHGRLPTMHDAILGFY